MRVQAGLQPEDWERWGQFTTFKTNAADVLRKELRPNQVIYCSPLTDPYQPAESEGRFMPALLEALIERPPAVFVLQTRGPLTLRDLPLLLRLHARTQLRISFSLTTDDDAVRRRFEPLCASIAERASAMRAMTEAGLRVHATIAPLLPCNPAALAALALSCSSGDVICDTLHLRPSKPRGATTREGALRILDHAGLGSWTGSATQMEIVALIESAITAAGRRFGTGPRAFGWLAHKSGG